MAQKKEININIADEDLSYLKENKYVLCCAKKIENKIYNIVWQADSKFTTRNSLSWENQFRAFFSRNFSNGDMLKKGPESTNFTLGVQIEIDDDGKFKEPTTGPEKEAIALISHYKDTIHPGLIQACQGFDSKNNEQPFYVATAAMLPGTTFITPQDKVLVWFEKEVKAGMMFSYEPVKCTAGVDLPDNTRTWAVELDLTDIDTTTKIYQDYTWHNYP